MKIFKVFLLCMLVVVAVFTGWHFYMKSTWDHHLVGTVYVLDKQISLQNSNNGEFKELSKEEFLEQAVNNNIDIQTVNADTGINKIFKVKIAYSNGEYRWVSNYNKRLTKRLEHDGQWDFYIYETEDKSEFIKIRYNLFGSMGCSGRQNYWGGNFDVIQKINGSQNIKFSGHFYYYEHPVQFFICYKMVDYSPLATLFY